MYALVTCGPSYEPLDGVRRLTNLSTGGLGVGLTERLSTAGADVVCLKGETATHRDPASPAQVECFSTNDDLEARLRRWASQQAFEVVFHAAALCDFRVTHLEDPTGRPLHSGKISTQVDRLLVHLAPTRKLIGELRNWFPQARIVGWKYEVDGTVKEATQRGQEQVKANRTDACVVNGPACGTEFHVCLSSGRIETCADRSALVDYLASTFGPGAPRRSL